MKANTEGSRDKSGKTTWRKRGERGLRTNMPLTWNLFIFRPLKLWRQMVSIVKKVTLKITAAHVFPFPHLRVWDLPCLVSLAAAVPCSPAPLCLPRATFSCWPCHPCAPMSCASPPGHTAPHTPLILQQHCSCCWLCQLPSPAAPSVIWVLGPSRGEPSHWADYFLLLNNCPPSKILWLSNHFHLGVKQLLIHGALSGKVSSIKHWTT